MNAGICVCVLLAAFSGSSLGRPSHSQDEGKPEHPQLDSVMSPQHTRHTRSAPSSGQLTPFSKPAEDESEDPRTSLRELLARLISRKGNLPTSFLSLRASSSVIIHLSGCCHNPVMALSCCCCLALLKLDFWTFINNQINGYILPF
uniref:Gastrin/cholecystokinin peptide hormone domain-containing protein n=1 Tax=Hucho hucho TaxID=62062 RepID=A0A4W5JRK1_9TELE